MASKAHYAALFQATVGLPATWNWELDSQPERYENPEDYIELAKQLTPASHSFAASILAEAGYIKPEDQAKTVSALGQLGHDETLHLGGVSIKWRVKSENSISDKILKDNKRSDDIGDYFGVKFIAHDVGDVVRLRDAILNSGNISSRKCEFTYPSDRGYRSHKSHHQVHQDGRSLSVEAIITHADFEISDQLTHTLINMERNVLRRQFDTKDPKLCKRFASCAEGLKETRTRINHETAQDAGLNVLCAPDAVTKTQQNHSIDNWARKIVHGIVPASFRLNRDHV